MIGRTTVVRGRERECERTERMNIEWLGEKMGERKCGKSKIESWCSTFLKSGHCKKRYVC